MSLASQPRPSVLVVTSSSSQLFSGTGTALFDWMRHARDALEFALLMDPDEPLSFRSAASFCRETDIPLHVSEGEAVPGCPDHRPVGIAHMLSSRHWDAVECISWANAATNMEVLANQPTGTKLLFTPHTQPLWTLPTPERYFMVPPVFKQMLHASDLVMTVSPTELADLTAASLDPARACFVPLGVDTVHFSPAPDPDPQLAGPPRVLVVADFREHRKRPDLLLQALEMMLQANPRLLPVLAGRDSDKLGLGGLVAAKAERLGFVSDAELLRQYRAAHVFLLLSDFEAFGLPIAEALCCGTPVIIHAQPETTALFGQLPGVSIISNLDLIGVRDALLAHAACPPDRAKIAAAAAARFDTRLTNRRKLARVQTLLLQTGEAARGGAC